jgi:predicted ATPase/class 3 adenylate cyclase/DNA-binding CsgD family transcriptional regulator
MLERALPVGTVTFLLTDIAGSTAGWEADPSAMAKAVARHYEILDVAIAAAGGVRPVEQGEGDSVVAAFSRATDAVRAAVDAQLALGAEMWPGGVPLEVRMAVHTGEVSLRDEGNYFGPALNRCARLRAVAHGGQVVCSRATAELAADDLPGEVMLVDLGVHRLRDLGRPESVFQVSHERLPVTFPPLHSLDATPNNLPVQLTTFIGRSGEIRELKRLLDEHRLVTLTGAGGAGKSRLAAQVGAEVIAGYPDGAWWVDLAPLASPDLVVETVLGVLDIHDAPGRPAEQRLSAHLAGRRLLLVLDNCEHVLAAAAGLAEAALRAAPGVAVLTTSREPLGVPGEVAWRVPPLSLPEQGTPLETEALGSYEAVRLFVDRALQARSNFAVTNETAPLVAEICTRLDGIPLAVELAAARVRLLSPAQILAGLEDRFRLLTGGGRSVVARQQTLEASVEWSHDLLSEPERALHRRLGVFAGGFDLDAAEAVCAGAGGPEAPEVLDLLDSLVAKSLVVVDDGNAGVSRYRLLETIRHFALLQLRRAGEAESQRDAHLRFYVMAAAEAEAALVSASPAVLARVSADQDNYRTALEWALAGGDADVAMGLARNLGFVLVHRGRHREAKEGAERALALSGGSPLARSRARWIVGFAQWYQGDFAGLAVTSTETLAEAQESGDPATIGRAHQLCAWLQAFTDPAGCRENVTLGLALAEATGDTWAVIDLLYTRAAVAALADDHREAAPWQERGRRAAEAAGNHRLLAWALFTGALSALRLGRLTSAREAAQRAVTLAAGLGDEIQGSLCAAVLARAEVAAGNPEAAVVFLERPLRAAQEAGSVLALAWLLSAQAETAAARGDPDAGPQLDRAASVAVEVGDPYTIAPAALAAVRHHVRTGDFERASGYLDQARDAGAFYGSPWVEAGVLEGRANLAAARDELDRAEDLHHQALALRVANEFALGVVDSLEALAGLAAAGQSWAESSRLLAASDRRRAELGYPPDYYAGANRASVEEEASKGLGDDAAAEARSAGAELSIDAAIAYATRARGERKRPSHGWGSLTPTEREVVALVAQGLSNAEIGRRLFISTGTAKVHLNHIFTKLGVSSRSELAVAATRREGDG